MTLPDRLSIEQCEVNTKRIDLYESERSVYQQLADVMRENERLREALGLICGRVSTGSSGYITATELDEIAVDALDNTQKSFVWEQRCKHTEVK